MRPEQTILLSDLDGTLFNSKGVVTPENRKAIEEYIAAGHIGVDEAPAPVVLGNAVAWAVDR